MTIDYAKAYSNERMVRAQMKRCQREAVLAYKATRSVSAQPIRTTIGERFINIGSISPTLARKCQQSETSVASDTRSALARPPITAAGSGGHCNVSLRPLLWSGNTPPVGWLAGSPIS